MNIKKSNFLSLKFKLNFIFFINKRLKIKNGIKIIICFKINKDGLIKWFIISNSPAFVLASP